MARACKSAGEYSSTGRDRPTLTPEARENRLIAKAMNLAEKQIDEGTASSQVLTHFLKLATTKAELEKEKLRHETELLNARTKSLESTERIEEMYSKAISAMQRYSGNGGGTDVY